MDSGITVGKTMRAGNAMRVYAAMILTFLAADAIWLGVVARSFYFDKLGYLLTEQIVWPAAAVFYALFLFTQGYFVVLPGVVRGSWRRVVGEGILFGLCAYGTYDLTNWATVRDWPWIVSIVDMIWGGSVSALVAIAGYVAGRHWFLGETAGGEKAA